MLNVLFIIQPYPKLFNISIVHPSIHSSLGITWQGHETDHSFPSSAEVNKGEAIPPVPHMPSWCNA
jgi:hypothetical protein